MTKAHCAYLSRLRSSTQHVYPNYIGSVFCIKDVSIKVLMCLKVQTMASLMWGPICKIENKLNMRLLTAERPAVKFNPKGHTKF